MLKKTSRSGSVKAVRIGTTDSSAGGATIVTALTADVVTNANTSASRAIEVQENSANGVDDNTDAIYLESVNRARWANGIVFKQCDRELRKKQRVIVGLEAVEDIPIREPDLETVMAQRDLQHQVQQAIAKGIWW